MARASKPKTSAATHFATASRWVRIERTGAQGGMARQHVPSGPGPLLHGPPSDVGSPQFHLPLLCDGTHANKVWHLPSLSGPRLQALPDVKRPQVHFGSALSWAGFQRPKFCNSFTLRRPGRIGINNCHMETCQDNQAIGCRDVDKQPNLQSPLMSILKI